MTSVVVTGATHVRILLMTPSPFFVDNFRNCQWSIKFPHFADDLRGGHWSIQFSYFVGNVRHGLRRSNTTRKGFFYLHNSGIVHPSKTIGEAT